MCYQEVISIREFGVGSNYENNVYYFRKDLVVNTKKKGRGFF